MFLKLFASFILGIVSAYLYEFIAGFIGRNIFNRYSLVVGGFKLHHSLYGVLFLILAYLNKNAYLAGFALGIIVQHTFTDGLKFIQRI